MTDVKEFLRVISERSKFDVVDHSLTATQLRVIGRIPHDELSHNVQNWLIIARNLLMAAEQAPWNVDVSKQYFLKGTGATKKIVYAHRLIIQGQAIPNLIGELITIVTGSKQTASVQLEQFPLHGETAERNLGKNGKGARNTVGG